MSRKNNNTGNGAASTLKQLKEIAGLFTCVLEHNVQNTKSQFVWSGPKIPPEEWEKILAFFQWTYDTTHSESQVRLYVNPVSKTWAAWAYPQEARTGMSAKELEEHPKFQEQRLQFNPDDGWRYFGTIHHHCNMGAFQSGTDLDNEKNQDGLHITVGNMGDARYTIHDRFYMSGCLIPHKMNWFWDIGEAMKEVPEWAVKLLPLNTEDMIARGMMCDKVSKDAKFPKEWQDNLVYHKPVEVKHTPYTGAYQGGMGYHVDNDWNVNGFQRKHTNTNYELRKAREQFTKLCAELKVDEVSALSEMDEVLTKSDFWPAIINLMYRNDVSLDKLVEFIEDDLIGTPELGGMHEEMVEHIKRADAEGMKQNDGIPDYEGSDFGGGKLPE